MCELSQNVFSLQLPTTQPRYFLSRLFLARKALEPPRGGARHRAAMLPCPGAEVAPLLLRVDSF